VTTYVIKIFFVAFLLSQFAGCVSDKTDHRDSLSFYQETLVTVGPQERLSDEGLGSLNPVKKPLLPYLEETKDSAGTTIIRLSLEDAILRALAYNPEITAVSVDPSIAREDITRAASQFDFISFGQARYEREDNPTDSIFQVGQSRSSLWQAGVKQKGITGAEWSVDYSLSRTTDDLVTRTMPLRYEPVFTFQIKQPLLRDAWPDLNTAGINIARLNYERALAAFHQKAEDVTAEVIALYWTLLEAQKDVEIQQSLLDTTAETMRKVGNRVSVDSTYVQIKQAETYLMSRKAVLLDAQERAEDVQDSLVRLIPDHQLSLLNKLEINPVTSPNINGIEFDQSDIIERALKNNPAIRQARQELDIADINIRIAKREKMPRIDLVASSKVHALSNDRGEALDRLEDADFWGYMIGVSLEYPFGNRDRDALYHQRKLERSKAVSNLQNISDRTAEQCRQAIRAARTKHEAMEVQRKNTDAARLHLESVETIETVREQLTPEFLLVKLQAQELFADAQRQEIRAIVDYNIALARLAQTTGSVLNMNYAENALPKISTFTTPRLVISIPEKQGLDLPINYPAVLIISDPEKSE
jgi:outer membrane protein TolC